MNVQKILAGLMLLLMIPAFCGGQPHTVSFVDQVGTSLTVTNSSESTTYMLKRIELQTANTNVSPQLTIAQIRTYKLPDLRSSTITTSEVVNPVTGIGWVTTNLYRYGQGAITLTNIISLAHTAAAAVKWFDRDDFGDGLSFEYEDVNTFTMPSSSTVDLIRVYDVEKRP